MGFIVSQDSIDMPGVVAVDLDGTLVKSDTLQELLLLLIKQDFLAFCKAIFLIFDKATFKSYVCSKVQLDPVFLPYNLELLEWLKDQKLMGRKIVLATAADRVIAEAVANEIGLFDEVKSSDGIQNLSGAAKKAALDLAYGPNGYIYVGNSSTDLEVWNGAKSAVVVNASKQTLNSATAIVDEVIELPSKTYLLPELIRVMRPHQWLKNILLFVPLLAAHQFGNLSSLLTLFLAFTSFSLCASAVYVINDLLDLDSDRRHPRKHNRPFAAGNVPIWAGAVLAPLLLALSIAVGIIVGHAFMAWLFFYFVLTSAYSLVLKRIVLVDCLVLAALYTLRIVAGATTVVVDPSFWLLAFSVFSFLSLAFLKRYAELKLQKTLGGGHAHGRGYIVDDAPLIQSLGISAGFSAGLVLALYLQTEIVTVLYSQPVFIWSVVPLMIFWISWVWLKAHRDEMHDDPLVFAIRDNVSRATIGLAAVALTLATVGIGN